MTRTEMIEKLKKYQGQDGTYHVSAIIADENPGADSLSLTFATFFGGDEEYNEAEESELVKLARELNEQHGEQQDREDDDRVKEIIAKSDRGDRLTNEEQYFLVETGHAYNVYDDPDSNRPTGIVIESAGLRERAKEKTMSDLIPDSVVRSWPTVIGDKKMSAKRVVSRAEFDRFAKAADSLTTTAHTNIGLYDAVACFASPTHIQNYRVWIESLNPEADGHIEEITREKAGELLSL